MKIRGLKMVQKSINEDLLIIIKVQLEISMWKLEKDGNYFKVK